MEAALVIFALFSALSIPVAWYVDTHEAEARRVGDRIFGGDE